MTDTETSEQAKPFAPSSAFQSRSDEEAAALTTTKSVKSGNPNCFKICGCITAFVLILSVAIIVLSLTVFHIKRPVIKMNRIILSQLNNASQLTTNLTFFADVSVKNPNFGSFKFNNGTITIFHGGEVIGEGVSPAGVAKAKRTIRMNVTVIVMPEKITETGRLSMNSSTVIGGKVKILKMIKKHVKVEVNCSVIYHLQSQEIQQNCRPHIC